MLWVILAVALVGVLYYFVAIRPFKYWTDRGVPQTSPVPLFGDSWGTFVKTQSLPAFVEYVYNACPKSLRYSGMYQFTLPTLVLKDPDLIKQITVKDFDHFLDHKNFIPDEIDPLWARNLFALQGQKWKNMRATLSPAFTSSKMKQMFVLMSEIGEQFVRYFLKQNEDIITVEMKDTFTKFTNDVIASTAFGIQCDSLDKPKNEFYLMGKEATDFSGFWRNLKVIGFIFFPKILAIFNVRLFTKKVHTFFTKLVSENIASRKKHGIVRPDMIHLLMQAQKNELEHDDNQSNEDAGFATVQESEVGKATVRKTAMTDLDITAQALIFFFAGFDSVSSLMCFMSYELAVNPDIQQRLRNEVDEIHKKCNGKLTYESLLEMKYMDMVTSETLRKWPVAAAVDRMCTKPYTIEPETSGERPLHLKVGDLLWLPIFGLQRDPKYYPEPERFDPERFNDDNKHKINPYTYIPFGSGPRNCIGSRFALLESKALFFYILSNFEIVPVEKTAIPLKLSKKHFNLTAEGGFWLGLKRRNNSTQNGV